MKNDFKFDFEEDDLEDDEPQEGTYRSPLSSDDDPEYVVEGKEVVKEGAKSILGLLAWGAGALVVILVVIYALFAATLMYLAPSPADGDGLGDRLHVARDTFTADKIPAGAVVYGSASGVVSDGFLNRMLEGFIGVQDPIVMEVLSGPVNVLESKGGKLVVDGKRTDIDSTMKRTILDDQFLVQCLDGSCTPGDHFIIDLEGISGQVVGTTEGFTYTQATDPAGFKG